MEYTITIDWIRHGYSCANAIRSKTLFINNGYLVEDPVLTNDGIKQAEFLSSKKEKYDIVCCSHLRRALETALYTFGNEIYVIPFVSEKKSTFLDLFGLDKENRPIGNIKDLEYHATSIISNENIKANINFSIINDFKDCDINRESYDTFIKMVLPKIIKIVGKKNIKIAIVSHNIFIRSIVKKVDNIDIDLYNTGIVRELFTYNIVNGSITRIKSCDTYLCKIYDGIPYPIDKNLDRCIDYHNKIFSYYDMYIKEKTKYITMRNNLV